MSGLPFNIASQLEKSQHQLAIMRKIKETFVDGNKSRAIMRRASEFLQIGQTGAPMPKPIKPRPKRSQLFQKQHDRHIELIAKWGWEDQGYPVGTNPGQNKFHPVGGVYPDIVVYHTTKYNIATIAEVETKESVTNSEALSQWKKYGNLAHPFYLFVPQESVQVASRLIRKHKINCNSLFGFWFENNILHVCQLLTSDQGEAR